MEVLEAVNGRVRGTIPTEETVSLRCTLDVKYLRHTEKGVYHTPTKFYLNINRKSLLECGALFPPGFVIATVHLICEGNLLAIPRG